MRKLPETRESPNRSLVSVCGFDYVPAGGTAVPPIASPPLSKHRTNPEDVLQLVDLRKKIATHR